MGRRIDLVDKRPQSKNSELAPSQIFQTEKLLSKMLELWSSVTVRKRKSHYLLLLYVNYFIPTNQPVHIPSSMQGSIKRKCILTWPKCNLCTLQTQLTECVGNTLGERKPFPSFSGNTVFLNPGNIQMLWRTLRAMTGSLQEHCIWHSDHSGNFFGIQIVLTLAEINFNFQFWDALLT